ncbi:MAG: hypothetical protein LBQ52_04665 [Helicobacteraceae bacterium]|jgi:hypothetical protein|nr:hypothetical protein [Helicobacteraceae bacterium]
MDKVYLVEGGLGKAIAFSALTRKLANKDGDKIKIITPYVDVFFWSDCVKKTYHSNDYLTQKENDEKIIYAEPYKCEYQFNDQHICEWWAEQFGIDFDKDKDLPEIMLSKEAIEVGQRAIAPYEGREIGLVQFSGGQPAEGFNPNAPYDFNLMRGIRNYPPQMANILMRRLIEKYPNILWLNFALKNEPDIWGTLKIETPYIGAFSFIHKAKYIIGIDSSLNHLCAAANKPSVALWNSHAQARPHKYGWRVAKHLIAANMEHDYIDVINALEAIESQEVLSLPAPVETREINEKEGENG